MRYVVADFETWPIMSRPHYPPKPVGLALWEPEQAPYYMSWGHQGGGNNSNEAAARDRLLSLWNDPGVELVFHHAKFDMGVAEERWGFQPLPWHRWHDTMYLAFLNNPYESRLGLKPLADKYLKMPPEEQDAVARWVQANKYRLESDWLVYHQPAQGGSLKVQKGKEGAWIFEAPADIVEPYAIGDVVRTGGLFSLMWPAIERHEMGEAYDRERRLLPILMANERRGMRVDMDRLGNDIEIYQRAFDLVEERLRQALHASGLNFDADQDVAAILISSGVVPHENFTLTKATKAYPNGQYSMSKETLLPELFTGQTRDGVPGSAIISALGYRNRLGTCLNTFMKPWFLQGSMNGGYITTNWSQVRADAGGAKTGRITTSDHNFLNLPKSFADRDDQYVHPAFLGVPELPLCRGYILPDEGEVFLHRDFSGQELRVFAHGEQGALWDQYQADPKVDVHGFVGAELMKAAGREIERTKIKVMNFQALYGGGVPALAAKLRVSTKEAKELKQWHDRALPGRKMVAEEITRIARRGDPIRTAGGRLYWPTEPGEHGRETFYKLLNYWVQGGAADLTKQAIIDWAAIHSELPPWVPPARLMVSVYDEIDLSSPTENAPMHMRLLKYAMELPRLSVKMLSDGKSGPAWGQLQKYKDE